MVWVNYVENVEEKIMKIKFKKRNPQLGLPGMINDVSDLDDYTGNNIIKSHELNDFDWLGPLAGCPGVATGASIGYIYVLPFDVKFVYNKNECISSSVFSGWENIGSGLYERLSFNPMYESYHKKSWSLSKIFKVFSNGFL